MDPAFKESFPDLRATPILIDGVLYAPNGVGLVEAFHPATGETLWVQAPFAETLQEAAGQSSRGVDYWGEGAEVPPLGVASRPAALVTKTLLLMGEGGDVFGGVQANMWGKGFRAYDKATGEVIWEIELPAGVTGGPMTYMFEGKQYIVVPVGGREEPAEWVALGLP